MLADVIKIRHVKSYFNDALAGGERQAHHTGAVDGHDLIADVQSSRLGRRSAVHQAGDDDRGEDGAPAGLHDYYTQNLPFLLLDVHLTQTHLKYCRSVLSEYCLMFQTYSSSDFIQWKSYDCWRLYRRW